MPKYRIYAVYTASKFLGDVEAATKEDAEAQGWEMDYYVGLCHQCANEVDLNEDPHTMQVEATECQP
jgi:hypothetical protein